MARGYHIGRHRCNQCWKVKKDQVPQSRASGPSLLPDTTTCPIDIHLWPAWLTLCQEVRRDVNNQPGRSFLRVSLPLLWVLHRHPFSVRVKAKALPSTLFSKTPPHINFSRHTGFLAVPPTCQEHSHLRVFCTRRANTPPGTFFPQCPGLAPSSPSRAGWKVTFSMWPFLTSTIHTGDLTLLPSPCVPTTQNGA